MRRDLANSLKPFKHEYGRFVEYQEWREAKWEQRKFYTLSNYDKQRKDFEEWR
jgi:hypothetical protein